MRGFNPAIASAIMRDRKRPIQLAQGPPRRVPPPDPVIEVTESSLVVFVSTRLVNPLNTSEHPMTRAKRVKRQREAVCTVVWLALRGARLYVTAPAAPKHVTLVAHVPQKFDSHDNLRAALKPTVDGLMDAGLITDDRDSAGHRFDYYQLVTRARRGVVIGVRVR